MPSEATASIGAVPVTSLEARRRNGSRRRRPSTSSRWSARCRARLHPSLPVDVDATERLAEQVLELVRRELALVERVLRSVVAAVRSEASRRRARRPASTRGEPRRRSVPVAAGARSPRTRRPRRTRRLLARAAAGRRRRTRRSRRRSVRARSRSRLRSRRRRRRCPRPRRETRCRSPRRNRRRARACRRSTAGRTRSASGAARRSPARSRPARCARDGSTIAHNSKVSFDRLAGAPQAHDARAGGPARARGHDRDDAARRGLDPAVARAGPHAPVGRPARARGAWRSSYAARRGSAHGRSRRRSWRAALVAVAVVSASRGRQARGSRSAAPSRSRSCSSSPSRSPAASSPELVLEGVVLGAVAVAVGGLLLLVFDYDRAVQAATTVSPARYQGLGGGPNMAAMVFALAAPLAFHFLSRGADADDARGVGGVARRCCSRSIALSGSRGALAAVFTGLAVYALLARRPLVLGTAAALAGATLALSVLPSPASSNPPQPTGQDPAPAQVDAGAGLPRREPARPAAPGRHRPPRRRRRGHDTPASARSPVRAAAPRRGAARSASPRTGRSSATASGPRTGRSSTATCSSTRTFPRTRTSGSCCSSGSSASCCCSRSRSSLVAGLRSDVARAASPRQRPAAFAAALVLALFQSYLYAPGNAATITAWVCAFAVSGAAAAVRS